MSGGERPMGAAKGKQSDTEALCQHPPPPRGRPTPGVVKQDKSSGGSVDTTKTRSDPQRVRMSSGEGPMGAAKGKPPNTEALPAPCQPPRPPHGGRRQPSYSGLWTWMQSHASSHWHNGMPANGGRLPTGVGYPPTGVG